MPIHLTGIEPVETLPVDLSTYEDGYPVLNEADSKIYLARTNLATPAWVEVAGGGAGGAGIGHPAQSFNLHPTKVQQSLRKFKVEWSPGDATWHESYDDLTWDANSHAFNLPQFGAVGASTPNMLRMTLRWIVPLDGVFTLESNAAEAGDFDITVTANGVAEATVNNATPVTINANVTAGANEVVILYENVSGTVTGSTEEFTVSVAPTTPPDEGAVFIDDFTGSLVQFSNSEYHPVGMDDVPIIGGAASSGAAVTKNSTLDPSSGVLANVIALLGGVNVGELGTSTAIAIGHQAVVDAMPQISDFGSYGYSGVAIGEDAVALIESTALGSGANAGTYAVAIGWSTAYDECIAIGESAMAAPARTTFDPGGSATPAAPAGGAGTGSWGVYLYDIRGVDVDGFPITNWEFLGTAVLTDDHTDLTWGTGGWPAAVTNVQIKRQDPDKTYTFLTAAVGAGALTDDFSVKDSLLDSHREMAWLDFFGWGRDRRSIAIGFDADARFGNSVVIDNDASAAAYDGHFLLGNAGNIIDHPGGMVERIRAVTSAHTCDSDGDFDRIVTGDATSAAFSVTLPSAPPTGRKVTVKKIDSSGNAVTVATPGAETIDGAGSHSLAAQWDTVTVVYNGTNWLII